MSMVKGVMQHKQILIMEVGIGKPLTDLSISLEFSGVGGLAKFHSRTIELNGLVAPRIFGDFSIDHIFTIVILRKLLQ